MKWLGLLEVQSICISDSFTHFGCFVGQIMLFVFFLCTIARESHCLPFMSKLAVHPVSLFHPYAQGPKGENVGSITQPLPSNYLIFRAASESDGEDNVWLFTSLCA